MTDLSATLAPVLSPLRGLWRRLDGAWTVLALLIIGAAVLVPADLPTRLGEAAGFLLNTAPFILFAVLSLAYIKAAGAEALLARAFTGNPHRMILLAALLGGLSPFCSCEVIPFIAMLLAVGVPLSAVMAFWLASPLMDPAMFLITTGALGVDFAMAKVVAAVGLGLFGGYGMHLLTSSGAFSNPLKTAQRSGCCGAKKPFEGKPVWRFWQEPARRETFGEEALANGHFLLKWLALAYFIEALMIAYMPADLIAQILGGSGIGPILLGALVGGPAYLNGYAAPPLLAGLVEQGMSAGAAMSFLIAGGVSSIPAAVAVWALVRPPVFAAYIAFGFTGAVLAGSVWALAA
ncbi:MAG: permease [Pseudomonadota bacterium]